MINIEVIEISGWQGAFHGMRNPMNSWDKSDFHVIPMDFAETMEENKMVKMCGNYYFPDIGPNDHGLAMKLCKGGSDDRKFMRMIHVQADIKAPLYWWKEFDTYRMGVEKNSCSTMHKIQEKEFVPEDFSVENLMDVAFPVGEYVETYRNILNDDIIDGLNHARRMFIQTKEKVWWWQMIQLLPSSYNQLRTVDMSYEALRNMYHARKHHKLDEWRDFCEWVETLPYYEFITGEKNIED